MRTSIVAASIALTLGASSLCAQSDTLGAVAGTSRKAIVVRQITDSTSGNYMPQWSTDGGLLYYLSNRNGLTDLYAERVADDGAVFGALTRLTTGLNAHSFTFTADGRQYVAVTTGLGGGSPRLVPSTIAPEIRVPTTGQALYVFALPERK